MIALARSAPARIRTGLAPVTEVSDVWTRRRIALVSRRLDCLYLPVPKAANTSIKAALIAFERGAPLAADFPVHAYESAELVSWDAAHAFPGLRFSFVRNPFARLLSCFRDKILAEDETRDGYVRGVHQSFVPLGGFRAGMRFEDFARRVARIPDARTDIHFVSQHAILVGCEGLRVDFIGRVEQLEAHWHHVCRMLGRELPLSHRNASGAAASDDDYREHYDRRTRRRVERRYRADLALLGYRF